MGEAFREFARSLDAPEAWFIVALAAAAGGFALWQAFRALKRALLVEDTPTSLIRSAAQGYCELFGHAELMPGAPIRAPLTAETCIWWEYSVEEKVRSGKNTHWRVIEHDVCGSLFALDDPTGRCVVDPDGAEVIGPPKRTWYGNSPRPMLGPAAGSRWGLGNGYRYSQRLIPPETQLLAIGDGYVEIQNTKEAGGLAVAVASDEAHNGSGRIDAWKRQRLLGVGADFVIPDFRDAVALLHWILER